MAVNCQVTSLAATPRTEAEPASLMTNRRSSVPFAAVFWAPDFGSSSPPLVTTLSCTCPVARMTSVLPAGTAMATAAGIGSPARSPGRITGGLPV